MRTFDEFSVNEIQALEESFRAGNMEQYNKLFVEFVSKEIDWDYLLKLQPEIFGHFYDSIDDVDEVWGFLNCVEDGLFQTEDGILYKHFQPGEFIPFNVYDFEKKLLMDKESHGAKEPKTNSGPNPITIAEPK